MILISKGAVFEIIALIYILAKNVVACIQLRLVFNLQKNTVKTFVNNRKCSEI